MSRFRKGETVDITIKGARVADTFESRKCPPGGPYEGTGTVLVVVLDGSPSLERSMAINLATPGVTVERQTPKHWPPMAGDMWQDGNGRRWFAQQRPDGVRLIPVFLSEGMNRNVAELPEHLLDSGRVFLVYREDIPF